MKLKITKRQREFMECGADEVLFGGAAGGGKSYAQLIDAMLYALKYSGSRQLILRRTFPDLERSLVMEHLKFYPRDCYRYTGSQHRGQFANGSTIEFGYCDNEKDVYRYQGAEYDTIRFDELTHFTHSMYIYLHSRLRGANPYPKQIKSSANPGGVGHAWVKERFIDPMPPRQLLATRTGTRVFLPSRVQDNPFLMRNDPAYLRRLENLDEKNRRALLLGEWDLFEGQFFAEFSRERHVCRPFALPAHWKRYLTLDYGMDMLAALWVAVDEEGRAWVYREVYQPGLIISAAARLLRQRMGEEIPEQVMAPPDLWNRRQETGKSAADIFAENGLLLTKTSNRRVDGWRAVREWLAPLPGPDKDQARLTIFDTCQNLLRTLPAVQHDTANPEDVAGQPHELTHAPDALRGFCVAWTAPASPLPGKLAHWEPDQYEDYEAADERTRAWLLEKWGMPRGL